MKKLNLLLVILILFLGSGLIFSQTKIWEKDLEGIDYGVYRLERIENNSFIISGPSADPDILSINFDRQGNILWQRHVTTHAIYKGYGQKLIYVNSSAVAMLLDYSNNITDSVFLPEIKNLDLYVYYINQANDEYYMEAQSLSGDKDQIFIYDKNLKFVRTFPVLDHSIGQIMSTATEDGNIYLGGWEYGQGVTSNIVSRVMKYDSLGNLIWNKELKDRDSPYLSLNDGALYVAATNFWAYKKNTFVWEIMKIDLSNGSTIWTKYYSGNPQKNSDIIMALGITSLPGGGIVALGFNNKLGRNGATNPLTIAYSSEGDSLWAIESTESNSLGRFQVATWSQYNAFMLGGSIDGVSKIWKYSIPGLTAVETESSGIPEKFSLAQNYPNPFNPTTTIKFSVTKSSFVTLKVYDLLGREVAVLVNKELDFGTYNTKFNAENLTSGVYIYRITIGRNFANSKKMMLLK